MMGEVHRNYVLYKKQKPKSKPIYRQIAVIEMEQYLVKTFIGEVVQWDPKFIGENSEAEVFFHQTLKQAVEDAEAEYKHSRDSGEWEPYDPTTLCSVCGNPLEAGTELATGDDGSIIHDECYVSRHIM